MNLPQARNKEIVVQKLGSELLVYNLKTNRAYNLNETSMIVFNACDGKTSFEDLKHKHNFSDDLIYFAINELKINNLIEGEPNNHFGGLSRREVVKRIGFASLVALPMISSLVAPKAAHAQSLICSTPGGAICATQSDCGTVAYCMTNLVNSCTCIGNCCVECPGINTVCNNACVDTQTDPNNCGGCGNVCSGLEVCTNGTCNLITL